MQLVAHTNEIGLEVVIDTETGASYASQSALARLVGVAKQSVNELKLVRSFELLEAELMTGNTVAPVRVTLFNENQIAKVIQHYAKTKPQAAIALEKLLEVGIRVFLHESVGYKVTSTATEQPQARQLPPIRDAIEYQQAIEKLPQIVDPILRSYLTQMFAEEMSLKCGNSLPGKKEPDLVLAAVKAREMGINLKPGEDAKLGSFVARHLEPQGKTQHGRYQVNVYHNTPQLEETIKAFFK